MSVKMPTSNEAYARDVAEFDPKSGSLVERVLFNHRLVVLVSCVLVTIVLGMCATHQYELSDGALSALTQYFDQVPKDATFGNGRVARKVFEVMVNRQASRLTCCAVWR